MSRLNRSVAVLIAVLACFIIPASLFAQEEQAPQQEPAPEPEGLTVTSADGEYSLTFAGRFQLRYEMEFDDYAPEHNSFSLRRLEPQLDATAFGGAIAFRFKPNFAQTAALSDGWVEFNFHPGAQLRAGQFRVPFNWERDVPPTRHQFVERSVANSQFQAVSGRDIGLMLSGNPLGELHYGVGVFSNQGVNAPRSDTTGHLFTGRVSYALLGEYALSEVPTTPPDGVNLAAGAGAYLSTENTARVWDQWYDSDTIEATAVSTTADLHLQVSRFSTHLTGFFWDVTSTDDVEEVMPDYQGYGYSGHGGVLIIPERLFASIRYASARPNLDEIAFSRREALLGVQTFHRGHDSKLHIEIGQISTHDGDDWQPEQILRMQYQFLF